MVEGEICLSVSSFTCDSTNHKCKIKFSVKDTGIGIPKELQERLFKAFSQVDSSTNRKYGGTGLGLAISHRLAELMGGKMWVESQANKGSTFSFTIEAEVVNEWSESLSLHNIFKGKKVLLVDDNKTNLKILTQALKAWGFITRSTDQSIEAWEWLQEEETFDLMILDREMPMLDGLVLVEKIRSLSTYEKIPIVILSSFENVPEVIIKNFNITNIITKPVQQSKLYNTLLATFKPSGKLNVKSDDLVKQTPKLDLEMPPLEILVAEDNKVNQEVALAILKNLGYAADIADNGLKVIEAVTKKKYDVILMDMQMPEMDGLEASRWINNNISKDYRPYIIALTANAMKEDEAVCLQAGMDDFITKPISLLSLKNVLENAKISRNL